MAGHSQFKNIMHKKGKADAIRARIFTKLAREITVAAKSGLPDVNANARLRLAVLAAKKESMPKDNIERAIKKAAEKGADSNFEEMRFEGFAPHGVSLIVDCLTDNKNRTAPEMRSFFTKNNGSLGEIGSVSFNFSRVGEIVYLKKVGAFDSFLDTAIEAGCEDAEDDGEEYYVYTSSTELHKVAKILEEKLGEPESVKLIFKPLNTIPLNDISHAQSVLDFIEKLEDNDDVQNVFANFELSDEVAKALENE